MGKTLILIHEKKYFFSLIPDNDAFDIETIYQKAREIFPRWLRRRKRGLTYYKFGVFGDWKNHIEEYDRIIVFDSSYSKQIDHIVRKNYFKNGCFIYFWNKMNETPTLAIQQMKSIDSNFKKYSYNKTDCEKYNICYNTTFYYPMKLANREHLTLDVVFLGAVKRENRLKELDEICKILKDLHIKIWIHVYGTSEYQPENFSLTMEQVDYKKYLQIISDGRAVLDIDVWKERGSSLRAMEALFFDKKYITNNKNIKEEKFYNPDNIFILGEDNLERLHDFIFSEVSPVSEEIKEYYLISSWIKRFQ